MYDLSAEETNNLRTLSMILILVVNDRLLDDKFPCKRQQFVLTENDKYSGYGFVFPACSSYSSTTVQRLTEYLIY